MTWGVLLEVAGVVYGVILLLAVAGFALATCRELHDEYQAERAERQIDGLERQWDLEVPA